MKPIRCLIGLHKGHVEPADELPEEIERSVAFYCVRCGAVIE